LHKAPPDAHEDVAQEVMLQAHRNPPSGVEEWAWLVGIAGHAICRWLDAENRRLFAEAGASSREVDWIGQSAHQACEAAERRRVVLSCLERLPPAEREVVVAHFGEGEKVPAVARRLGIKLNTGYTRASKGLRRFASLVRRYLAKRRLKKEDLAVPALLPMWLSRESAVAAPEPAAEERLSGSSHVQVSGSGSSPSSFFGAVWPTLAIAAGVLLALSLMPGRARWSSLGAADTSTIHAVAELASFEPALAAPLPLPPGALVAVSSSPSPQPSSAEPVSQAEPISHPPAESHPAEPRPGQSARPAPLPEHAPLPWRSSEAAWAFHIAGLRRRGALREAATEIAAFHLAYPASSLVLAPPAAAPGPSSSTSSSSPSTYPPAGSFGACASHARLSATQCLQKSPSSPRGHEHE
jgi:RNA polymerase sigma factor (sigma-70 family)